MIIFWWVEIQKRLKSKERHVKVTRYWIYLVQILLKHSEASIIICGSCFMETVIIMVNIFITFFNCVRCCKTLMCKRMIISQSTSDDIHLNCKSHRLLIPHNQITGLPLYFKGKKIHSNILVEAKAKITSLHLQTKFLY
jgi:hypothetical protein